MHRGVATFTLDYGKCPPWLFERMVKLGRAMIEVLIREYGPDEFIRRIADPVWFQSLGTVLAFDWNASGLTTILTAALKEAIRGQEKDLGIFICGGKGKTSKKTPEQIQDWGDKLLMHPRHTKNLIYNSKMSAKVDSALIQDGFDLYHHAFFFSKNGAWSVVQQGMNTAKGRARRYHWFSEDITDLIVEPHKGIVSDAFKVPTLNMSAKNSEASRNLSVQLVQSGYAPIIRDLQIIRKHFSSLSRMVSAKVNEQQLTFLELAPVEFKQHPVMHESFVRSKYLDKILYLLAERKPQNYQELLAQQGVGGRTIRALALVGEVIYGAAPSYEDPARYSFAHGGKDATPYPVDRKTYDQTIAVLRKAVQKARLPLTEKEKALKKLDGKRLEQ